MNRIALPIARYAPRTPGNREALVRALAQMALAVAARQSAVVEQMQEVA